MRLSICIIVTLIAGCRGGAEENDPANSTVTEILNLNQKIDSKKGKSTSSSSGQASDGKSDDNSLDMSESGGSESDSKKGTTKRPSYLPLSSEERHGWRKWHRKCKPCPADMAKKWNDRTISWICGGYQEARRSFKSSCMMKYRNCQDGTMFVKIHGYRCKDSDKYDHFFYEYAVADSEDSKSKSGESKSTEDEVKTDYNDD